MALHDIDTIVFVMLENRSFDHAVGYLSTAAANPPMAIEGLRDDPQWRAAHDNLHAGQHYALHRLDPATEQIDDPPHDHAAIARQIGTAAAATSVLGGFVDSYMTRSPPPADPSAVMGHYEQDGVPVFDFFARNYVLCDHWFAALPTGTQPNRLMAMSGHSAILDNAAVFLPDQALVYDWLAAHKVSWCAYQSGDFFPFFALMPGWVGEIMTSLALSELGGRGHFRRYDRLREHWTGTAAMPSVIFIEPEYTDGPHGTPNDDHPPTGIARGQALLADIYAILTANPARWAKTMMIVTYDEHGGFFDHVPPLEIPASVGGAAIDTTGVRVPAFIVSPQVAAGVPFSEPLDHTSFLQLLADRFNPGQDYSAEVGARQPHLGRLSTTLTQDAAIPPRAPAIDPAALATLAARIAAAPASAGTADSAGAANTATAFTNLAHQVATDHADLLAAGQWAALKDFVTTA